MAVLQREAVGRVDPQRLARNEILLAMVGRHVDEAGARVGGDMVGGEEGAGLGEEAAKCVHRVTGDSSGELSAYKIPTLLDAYLDTFQQLYFR